MLQHTVSIASRTTSVRYNGIIHDFMMPNPVRETAAATAAIEQAIAILRKALGTTSSVEGPSRLTTTTVR